MRAFSLSAITVALVACGGDAKPSPEAPAPPTASLVDCTKVASHIAATMSSAQPRPGATPAAVQDMVNTRCTQDAWTDETKRCLIAIKTIREGRACATSMTDEQRAAIRASAQALRASVTGPTDADDPSDDWIRHVVEEPPAQ